VLPVCECGRAPIGVLFRVRAKEAVEFFARDELAWVGAAVHDRTLGPLRQWRARRRKGQLALARVMLQTRRLDVGKKSRDGTQQEKVVALLFLN
jgi:hypothetical protein